MSKFVLRNLRNERRRIEKELHKIDNKIDRIENTEVVMEGTLDLNSLVRVEKSEVLFVNKNIDFNMKFKIRFEKYDNEVVCILTSNDSKFGKKQFTGKAVCAVDEDFDLSTGMTLAQNRAVKEIYEYIIKLFA